MPTRRRPKVDTPTSVAELQADPQNARKHGERNISAIVSGLEEVGAARSIVIDEDETAIAKDAGSQVRTLEQKLGIGQEQEPDEADAGEGQARSWLINRRELADLFGVHPITICKWERDDMPIAVRGSRGRPSKYDAKICLQWYVTRERAAITGDGRGFSPQQERALLDRKRVEELDLRLQVKRGKLVPVEDVERDFAECANAVKARLRRVPTSVADRVVSLASQGPHAITALLTSEIDSALRELSTSADVETGAA